MPITKFLPPGKLLDARTIAAMRAAYQKAIDGLEASQSAIVREIIAKRIIRTADEGEADPEELCDRGLASLGLRRSHRPGG